MNKKKFILFLISAAFSWAAHAEIGCMDNSYHMKKASDSKTYHYVQCNCDCKHHQIAADRGKCSKCTHYRDPGTFEIVQMKQEASKI